MRRLVAIRAGVLLLVVSLLMLGCGGGGGGGGTVQGAFSCRIDGQAFTGTFKWFRTVDGKIQVWGVTQDEMRYVEITFNPPTAVPATVSLVVPVATDWAMYDTNSEVGGNGTEYYSYTDGGGSGTLTITRFDADRIEGTFSFRACTNGNTAQVNVTEGVFDVRAGGLAGW